MDFKIHHNIHSVNLKYLTLYRTFIIREQKFNLKGESTEKKMIKTEGL